MGTRSPPCPSKCEAALRFSIANPVYLKNASKPRFETIDPTSTAVCLRVRQAALGQDRRQVTIPWLVRLAQEHQAANVVDARAEEHQQGPKWVGPAVKEIATNGNERGSSANGPMILSYKKKRQVVKQKEMSGKYHGIFSLLLLNGDSSGFAPIG